MDFNSNNCTWNVIDSIGVLTINDLPENRILRPEFVSVDQLKEWTGDTTLRGIVITGAGRHFSSGADLDGLREMAKEPYRLASEMQRGNELLNFIGNIPLPVVAAISGICFGAGLEIALSCHIRICSENSVFAFPESGLGIIPGLGGSMRLLKASDIETCMQMLLAGELFDAAMAKKAGIVHQVISEKQVKAFSIEYLKRLVADRPSEVIRSVVTAINNACFLPVDEALKRETAMFCDLAVKRFNS